MPSIFQKCLCGKVQLDKTKTKEDTQLEKLTNSEFRKAPKVSLGITPKESTVRKKNTVTLLTVWNITQNNILTSWLLVINLRLKYVEFGLREKPIMGKS